MPETIVDRLNGEFSALLQILEDAKEISLRSTADDNFRKSLLMDSASHFEHKMTEHVLNFIHKSTNGNLLATSFVKNKAVSRQYHTWFNWEQRNANSFFGLFGDGFCTFMKEKVGKDQDLADSIRAFLEIGAGRNRLVHQDFGSFYLEKTSPEIYQLYKKAMKFVNDFPYALDEFLK